MSPLRLSVLAVLLVECPRIRGNRANQDLGFVRVPTGKRRVDLLAPGAQYEQIDVGGPVVFLVAGSFVCKEVCLDPRVCRRRTPSTFLAMARSAADAEEAPILG